MNNEKGWQVEKKVTIETWLAVATLLGGLYLFGTGWEHRMTVVEAVNAQQTKLIEDSTTVMKDAEAKREKAQAKTDAEREALWKEVRQTNASVNQLIGELGAKRK